MAKAMATACLRVLWPWPQWKFLWHCHWSTSGVLGWKDMCNCNHLLLVEILCISVISVYCITSVLRHRLFNVLRKCTVVYFCCLLGCPHMSIMYTVINRIWNCLASLYDSLIMLMLVFQHMNQPCCCGCWTKLQHRPLLVSWADCPDCLRQLLLSSFPNSFADMPFANLQYGTQVSTLPKGMLGRLFVCIW